ncbi:Inositol-polyphosphate 4-phosphatase [Plasmopara halstedii]|uniref:Inositol-polyphosphate 4-phosphatase n=1 Tax=Plasmopara halstedii TaxID=4781 RepID=A0A0P1B6J0_PLAHL|nr:Inositol-polyphosphate 4-phosphatase [Plasmopara halstedii]CEG50021.1 Inositol-polyphosphate 4-phosphatase [Plasmopara halstedii]|eukprot:XP_024586390.1 Inositol-polyphosphate 4-phosphatase [Plasmopara halstedii]
MAAPQSPNLMSFDEEPELIVPHPSASASSSASYQSSDADATAQTMPSSIVEISLNDPEEDRKVLHFFVSCRDVDGNSLVSPARSAQTLVRGAFNMLSSATAMSNTRSPRARPPTEVNIEVKVTKETPIFGFGADIPVHDTAIPPLTTANGCLVDIDNHRDSRPASPYEATLTADGLLDSENYWSERCKSRNPRFSVGFSIRCKEPTEYDRHVQIIVMIPDEGTSTNKNSHVFGYASTSFQEMYTVATTGNYRQKMTLPVHSTVQEGVTVELQFADLQPQLHPLFDTQHNLFKSFLFYPLMKEENAEMQAANAKLAIEEAAEVDFSVKIPLQLLRSCQSELLQMYDEWKIRYNYNRKKNCYFDNDAEALSFGHDVFRVQVVCGRNLKTKSSAIAAASGDSEPTTDMDFRSSRTSGFSMGSVVGGRGGLVNRIKAAKWGNVASSSFSSNDSDAVEAGGEANNGVHSFVVVHFEEGVVGNHEFTVGKTNTEYDSTSPVWSTNKNATTKCPHGKPNVKYQTSQVLKSRVVVSPVNALKQFLFYRPSLPDQPLAGWLRFQVFNEHYGYMSGFENELIGEVMIPLQSVRDAMTVEEKKVFDDDDGAECGREDHYHSRPHQIVTSFTLVDWFDVRSPLTDEVSGQIQLRINILLANPLAPVNDSIVTGTQLESSRYVSRRYRRIEDCAPPSTDGLYEDKIPLSFLYPHVLHIRKQISEVADMIRVTEHLVEAKNTFKSSLDKRRADIQGIPTNLHVSYFRIFRRFGSDANGVDEHIASGRANAKVVEPNPPFAFSIHERLMPETHATVTCGAPTAHAMGLGNYGLREMELEMHNFQTVLEKINPQSSDSPHRDKEILLSEDSSDFFYPPVDDENEAEVEDDGFSSDTPVSGGQSNLAIDAPATPVEPLLKRKPSKYSIMARKAAAARVKALPKSPFVKKKSLRQLDQKNSDEKAASYAKYPSLRVDLEEVNTTMPIDNAVQLLCRLEMLRSEYYLRKSVAVSQSVSSLVACFMAELDLCLQERNEKVLDQLAKVGFLVGWESLISSHGKELHMISDAWVAIKCLETFSLKLCEGTADMEVVVEKKKVAGYIILIPIPATYFALLPESLRQGDLISVTSVLFTQGINEMQSLANMVGHSGVSIQRKINSTSFRTILEYYNRFTEICGIGMSEINVGSHPDEILRNLRVSVESENSASKNTCILLHAADAVRSLNGGRVTYCKSGKDRTAMSTTLEQARLLVQRKRHVLQEIETGCANENGPLEEVKVVANIMREFGVRIHVAKKNVGRFKYSFNSLQRKLLPEIYRPPLSTIQDMVTSVTARDS